MSHQRADTSQRPTTETDLTPSSENSAGVQSYNQDWGGKGQGEDGGGKRGNQREMVIWTHRPSQLTLNLSAKSQHNLHTVLLLPCPSVS